MQYRRDPNGTIVLSLARGETVRGALEGLVAELDVPSAKVSAVGALEEPELGWYELETKTYHRKTFPGIFELLSCQGNVARIDGAPILHAHVTLSQRGFEVIGGHLFDARVGLLLEVFLEPLERPIQREMNFSLGLAGWKIEEE